MKPTIHPVDGTDQLQAKLCIDIQVTTPFPWQAMLNYLSERLIGNKEYISQGYYHRAHWGYFIQIGYKKNTERLVVQINQSDQISDKPISKTLLFEEIKQRIKQLFQPQLETDCIYAQLNKHLPINKKYLGFRPLGAWDNFELCLRTIIGQQVSVKAAQTLMHRLQQRCPQLSPTEVAEANLSEIGMPGKRVATIQNFAQQVELKKIHLTTSWLTLREQLLQLKGIGPWTCDYLGIRLGRDNDAFPSSDLGLMRAVGASNARELERMADQWKPYRAYAAAYLWNHGSV